MSEIEKEENTKDMFIPEHSPLRFEIECDGNLIKVITHLPTSQENGIMGLANLLSMMKNNGLVNLIDQTLEGKSEYSEEQNKILQSLRAVITLSKMINSGTRPYHPGKIWEKMRGGM